MRSSDPDSCVELDPDLWTLVQVGVDSGVIVVGASGNGDVDLDDSSMDYYSDRGHSGAILDSNFSASCG